MPEFLLNEIWFVYSPLTAHHDSVFRTKIGINPSHETASSINWICANLVRSLFVVFPIHDINNIFPLYSIKNSDIIYPAEHLYKLRKVISRGIFCRSFLR